MGAPSDELDGLVVEDFVFARGELHVAELLAEFGDLRRIGGVEGRRARRRRAARRDHAEDVRVVEADGGELDVSASA